MGGGACSSHGTCRIRLYLDGFLIALSKTKNLRKIKEKERKGKEREKAKETLNSLVLIIAAIYPLNCLFLAWCQSSSL